MSSAEEQRIEHEIHRTGNGPDPFSSAVRATRMPMLITDPRQPDNPIVFVNDAFFRLTGYSREEILGKNCRFLQGPGTNMADVARVRDAIERRVPIEIDLLNYRKDGSTFWNRLLISPVFDDDELTFFFASQFDITPERERMSRLAGDRDALENEIRRRVSDLGAAEERLRFVLNAGGMGSWTLDLAHERLVASAVFKRIYGHDPADTFSYADLKAALPPKELERWEHTLAQATASDGGFELEHSLVTPDGETRWVMVRAQVDFDAVGHVISVDGVAIDITERKKTEVERDVLVREMDHRVKNTLATVQSLINQSLNNAASPREAQQTITDRLRALAGAHDVLVRHGWERAKLTEVVELAVRPFEGVRFGGPQVLLSARAATAISLALHELGTNAVKYGALSDGGKVVLNWHVKSGRFHLSWTEVDGPPVVPPQSKGFGSKLIGTLLADSLEGHSEIEYRPTGVVFRLEAPLNRLA